MFNLFATMKMRVRVEIVLNPIPIFLRNLGFIIALFTIGILSDKVQYLLLTIIGLVNGLITSIFGIIGFLLLIPHGIPEIIAICLFADEGYRYLKLNMKLRLKRVIVALVLLTIAAYLESFVLHKIEKEKVDPKNVDAKIFIAANYLDYSGYPDCRPEFYEKINSLLKFASKLGTEYGVEMKIETPLLFKNKKEIVELGIELNVPFEWTWSCYEGGEVPCGKCDSCLLREKGFREAGVEDPLLVRLKREGKL